jgi:rod shape-determining protein MreD
MAGLAVALLIHTTLGGLSLEAGTRVNFVLVAVVFIALLQGATSGLLAGMAGGLVQDAVAGGIVGIGGISKTVVGFLVGVLGAQFIVSQPLPRFVMFAGATVLHEVVFQALNALAESQGLRIHYRDVLTQAAVNGFVGILAFYLVEAAPGAMQRREARRASFTRRRF